jgi:hypothetical protein
MKVQQFISFLLAVLMALVVTQGALAVQETTVILSFAEGQLLFDQVRGYDRVRLADGDVLSRLGKPALPTQQVLVAIPSGTEAVAVRVRLLASQKLPGAYRIFPGQPPQRLDGSPPPAFVEPDERVYSSAQVYPGELGRLDGQTDLAGQQMAVVTVYPLQYVPVTGRLVLNQKMVVTVESQPGYISRESYAKFTEKQREVYQKRVWGMVVNPQDVVLDPPPKETSKALSVGQFGHVVITTESYVSYFDDLVEWHNKRGLRDTVVTTTSIYANYSGSDDQERIRNFVIDAHSTWGTLYFLIGGEDSAVPFKYRTYHNENTPSDNYYADYDDDWTCEVFVGRIPGAGSTQFSAAIDKILKYERDPPVSDYPLDVLLIGMDLDSSTPGEQLKETIDGYIPARFDVNKVYDSHSGNHLDVTRAYLNAGQNLVNHNDHSNSTVMGIGYVNHGLSLNMFHVNGLTNDDQPCNIVSTGCWPNDMTYNDCIAEHFVIYNPNQAGVSFTGNTRDGWYYVGYPEGLSGQLDRDWWRGVFQNGQDNLGEALVWSKHHFDQNASNTHRHCEWTFCLLGEPSMPIWTDTPESLDVNHATTLPVGNSSFLVHVESGGSDLSGAYVCLWKPGEVYLTDHTDSNGDVTLNASPTTPGTLFVTVTKHNYLPYEGSAQVNSSGPPPAIRDLEITLSRGDLVLSWTPPEEKEVVRYVIYRDHQSDFSPAPEDSIGGTIDTTYTDLGAAGMVGTNYCYAVKAVNGFGEKSDPSNTVGEYDIELIIEPAE